MALEVGVNKFLGNLTMPKNMFMVGRRARVDFEGIRQDGHSVLGTQKLDFSPHKTAQLPAI